MSGSPNLQKHGSASLSDQVIKLLGTLYSDKFPMFMLMNIISDKYNIGIRTRLVTSSMVPEQSTHFADQSITSIN